MSSKNSATTSKTPSKATPKPTSVSKKPRTPSAACSAKPPPKPPSLCPTPTRNSTPLLLQVAVFGALPNQRPRALCLDHTHYLCYLVYTVLMSRTNIELDDALVLKARKLTRLKTKREIVDRALELLVRSETRKGILRFYGSGVWKGDLKATRRSRV